MFDFLKKKKNVVEEAISVIEEPSVGEVISKINLNKEMVNKICLTKKPLANLKARVKLVLDYSGSMDELYYNGSVQRVVEKIVPLALQFDDDGELEVYLFSNGCRQIKNCSLANVAHYVKNNVSGSMGGTSYAPVIKEITSNCKGDLPDYVIFITDGNNDDYNQATDAIVRASRKPIFWQFIGIGNSHFSYLEELDDMEGRYVDNADFFPVNKMEDITYDKLLTEFPQWLEFPKVKEMLRR